MGAKREAKKALSQRTRCWYPVVTRPVTPLHGERREKERKKREAEKREKDNEGERGRVNCRKTHAGTKREAKKALSQRTMMLVRAEKEMLDYFFDTVEFRGTIFRN